MAINQHMQPAQTSLMQTYVPLPFKELAMVGAHNKEKSDEGELLYNTLDQSLLKVKARGHAHQQILSDYSKNFDTQLSNIYDKHGGDYMKMIPDLKVLKNTLAKDVTQGNLATIISQAEQAGLHDEGLVELKGKEGGKYYDEDLYWQIPGSAGRDWVDAQMWGLVENPNQEGVWDFDFPTGSENPYVTGEAKLPTAYSYSGHHHAAQEHDETKKVFDPIKTEVQQFVQDGMTVETQSKTINRIYKAAMNDYGSLSSNYRSEIEYLNGLNEGADPSHPVEKATEFLDVYYEVTGFMDNGDPIFGDLSGQDLLDRQQQYKDYIEALTLEDGTTPSDVARKLANINTVAQLGEKYVLGSTKIKSVSDSTKGFSVKRPDKTVVQISMDGYVEKNAMPVITEKEGGATYEPIHDASNPALAFKNYTRDLFIEYENMFKMYSQYMENEGSMSAEMKQEKLQQLQDLEYQIRAYKNVEHDLLHDTAYDMGVFARMDYGPEGEFKFPNRIWAKRTEVGKEHWQAYGYTNLFFGKDGKPVSLDEFMKIHDYKNEMQVYLDMEEHLAKQLENYKPSFYSQNIHDKQKMSGSDHMPVSIIGMMVHPDFYINNTDVFGDDRSLWKNAEDRIKEQKLFQGRDIRKRIVDSSGDADFDEQVAKALLPIFGNTGLQSVFRTPDGKQVSISDYFTEEWGATQWGEYLEDISDKNKAQSFSIQATPSHTVNNSSLYPGGFKGMLSIPTGGKHRGADSEDSTLNLFFDMPAEYTERKLTMYPDGTLYKDYGSDGAAEYLRVNMEYAVQLDLDAASDIPGDRIPTKKRGIPGGAMFETGEYDPNDTYPLGHWYFETNPITGQPLVSTDGTQMDQFLFRPTEGMLLDVTSDGTHVYATGNEVFNADTQLQEVFNVFALNDPNSKWAFDMIFGGNVLNNSADQLKEQFSYEGGIPAKEDITHIIEDKSGQRVEFELEEGQTLYPSRYKNSEGNNVNLVENPAINEVRNGQVWPNAGYEDYEGENALDEPLKLPLSHFLQSTNQELRTVGSDYLDNLDLDVLSGVTVTLSNGQTVDIAQALSDGRMTMEFTTGDDLELVQNNSNRDYKEQEKIYNDAKKKWEDGGKVGNIGAEKPNSSFHTLGQAIDIAGGEGIYDIILVDRTGYVPAIAQDDVPWQTMPSNKRHFYGKNFRPGVWIGQIKQPENYGFVGDYVDVFGDTWNVQKDDAQEFAKHEKNKTGALYAWPGYAGTPKSIKDDRRLGIGYIDYWAEGWYSQEYLEDLKALHGEKDYDYQVFPTGLGKTNPNDPFIPIGTNEAGGYIWGDGFFGENDWFDYRGEGYTAASPGWNSVRLGDITINGTKPFKNTQKELTKLVFDALWETKNNGDNSAILQKIGKPVTDKTMSENPLEKLYFKYSDLDFGQMPGEWWHWSVGENRDWNSTIKYPDWVE
tara:strand:- start:20256 stop:24533 length:4278 start_codon:yes stop_codon:yes gene_type:complete